MHDIAAKLEQMKAAIYTDFPAEVGPPVEQTQFGMITNFFRNGPKRKVVVFTSDGIDFQYDDDAREGDDSKLEVAMFNAFNVVLEQAERVLGTPLGHRPLDWSSVMDVEEYDDDDEGESCDDTAWTPEYDQGAVLACDEDRTRFWCMNGRYIFLQGGYITGDNDIVGYVAMTITPKLGDAEPAGEWPLVRGHLILSDGKPYLTVDENAQADPATIQDLVVYWQGATPLPALLHQLPRLEVLNLSVVGLPDLQFPLDAFSHLRTILIDGDRRSDDANSHPALRCVKDLIAQALVQVTTLDIRGFGSNKGDSLALADLRGIGRWRSLTSLGLTYNQCAFTRDEFDAFIDELRQLPLERLDLIGNESMAAPVPDDSGRTYFDLIRQALPGVRVYTVFS